MKNPAETHIHFFSEAGDLDSSITITDVPNSPDLAQIRIVGENANELLTWFVEYIGQNAIRRVNSTHGPQCYELVCLHRQGIKALNVFLLVKYNYNDEW